MAEHEPTLAEMQRQLIAFALDEMFNRGLEAAACVLDRRAASLGYNSCAEQRIAQDIRALKVDAQARLSDWWGHEAEER